MARDVFNRLVDTGRPLAADAIRMLVAGLVEEDMLAQQINLQYSQNINRLYEIGSAKIFLFAGRTQGQMSCNKIVGGRGPSASFIRQYGDVCNVPGNHITLMMDIGCENFGDIASIRQVRASGVVINTVAYSMQAQDTLIHEDLQMLFVRLEDI